MRTPGAVGANARSSRVSPASQSWRSYRFRTNGLLFTTRMVGSCERLYRVVKRDVKPPPGFSALSKRKPSTTRICMTLPACPTCNASLGRTSRFTVELCPDIPHLMAEGQGCQRQAAYRGAFTKFSVSASFAEEAYV